MFIYCGSTLSDTNGQNLISEEVIAITTPDRTFMYTPGSSIISILSVIKYYLYVYFTCIINKNVSIYLVVSRSTLGFWRDTPILLLSLFNVKIVTHAHGSEITELLTERWYSHLALYLYKKTQLIVPSNHLLSALSNHPSVHVIENFSKFQPAVLRTGEPFKYHIYWNSNLVYSKGILEFFTALQKYEEKFPNTPLQIAIVGTFLSDEYMSAVKLKGYFHSRISAFKHIKIHYFGPVSSDQSRKILLKSNAVILPSFYNSECQPLAIIEAMICKKYVIVNDTPALRATIGSYPHAEVVEHSSLFDAIHRVCLITGDLSLTREQEANLIDRFSRSTFYQKVSEIVK